MFSVSVLSVFISEKGSVTMNCPLCGAELKPYESLCQACREKQQNISSRTGGTMTPDFGIQQNTEPAQDHETEQPYYLRSGYSVTDEPGKPGIFRKYKKLLIISLIAVLIVAAGAVTTFMIIESRKPGYMSITSAAQHELDLMNAHKWNEIFAEVTDEEMELLFEYNEDGLIRNDIHNAAELRQTILLYSSLSQTMNGWHDAQLKADRVEREKGSLIEENIPNYLYYLASKEGVAKYWYSRTKADGKTSVTYLLLCKKDGRWISLNGLHLSARITEGIAKHNNEEETE